jgi:hypothetical protein
MPKRNDSDTINHLGVIRMRVKGSGNLKTTVFGYDFLNQTNVPEISLETSTNKLPTVLANHMDQKMMLEIKTTEFDEYFNINRITVFLRPVAAEYPQ